LISTAALAAPPFETPPTPDVPLGPPDIQAPPDERPPVPAPPIDVGRPVDIGALPDLPFDVPPGPPDPLPSTDSGIPDLIGVVDLPDGALDQVLDQAPPFGGEHGNAGRSVLPVPEPASALLIAFGLAGIAAHKRMKR
jgi:hypothetical protein